jgi:hypothetical protein
MIFQKAYFINLDSRPDRKQHIEAELSRVGIDAERISAVSGYKSAVTESHLLTLIQALKHQKNTLILEDDCVFGKYFNQEKFNLPYDWDIFYFGANHKIQPKQFSGNLGKAIKPLTAHSYVVKASSLLKVINVILAEIQSGKIIDEIYSEAIESGSIVAYCAMPNLTWQLPNHSDLEGRFMDYSFMIPERELENKKL